MASSSSNNSLGVLVEAKKEYLNQLYNIMCPHMIQTFQDIYNSAVKESKGKQVLRTFQKKLQETIPKWNNEIISTNVKNTSSVNFNGDYAIFIFDSTLSFVDTLNLIPNRSLPPNNVYTNNLSFTNSGLFRMLPGKYVAAIYFKPIGQGWQIVNNTNSFTNYIEIKVINSNAIELNSTISSLQTSPFKIGDSLNVTANVKNTSSSKYLGQYQLALYTLDGITVQQIGTTISDTLNGLPPNYTYVTPFLKFNSVVKVIFIFRN
jgi:hypothetical protein